MQSIKFIFSSQNAKFKLTMYEKNEREIYNIIKDLSQRWISTDAQNHVFSNLFDIKLRLNYSGEQQEIFRDKMIRAKVPRFNNIPMSI